MICCCSKAGTKACMNCQNNISNSKDTLTEYKYLSTTTSVDWEKLKERIT